MLIFCCGVAKYTLLTFSVDFSKKKQSSKICTFHFVKLELRFEWPNDFLHDIRYLAPQNDTISYSFVTFIFCGGFFLRMLNMHWNLYLTQLVYLPFLFI